MSLLIKKTFWPAAIVVGFLVFLGAIGYGPRSAEADIIGICGPEVIQEDETALYVVVSDDADNDLFADLDDSTGDSDITSITDEDDDYEELDNPTDFVNNVGVVDFGSSDFDDLLDDLEADFDFDLNDCIFQILDFDEDDLAEDLDEDIKAKIAAGESVLAFGDFDIDCPDATPTDPPFCAISSEIINAVVDALVEGILDFDFTDDLSDACADLAELALNAALNAGATLEIALQFEDAIEDQCLAGDLFDTFEGIAAIDVTCEEAGEFDLSVSEQGNSEDDTQAQIHVICAGEVDEIRLTITPNVVETVPAAGSVSYSLDVARLLDDNDDPAGGIASVDFMTNKCVFLEEDGLTEAQFREAAVIFEKHNRIKSVETAAAVNAFVATIPADPDDESNPVASFILDSSIRNELGSTIWSAGANLAAIIQDCSSDAIVPGPATVTAEVDQEGADVIATATKTVVGPPATVSAAASVASVTCGDVAQIVVTVRDSAGQNVSDHTLVEAVTNFGGVLGGTGAVAGQMGLVTPVSSTVAETFNGVATFTLVTSQTHVGTYNIVVATGGGGTVAGTALGGIFSTPVVTANVSVACTVAAAPAATPAVTAPRTGTGIVPPNTGDAGLVGPSGTGLSLFVIAGVAVFALAGIATLKVARR